MDLNELDRAIHPVLQRIMVALEATARSYMVGGTPVMDEFFHRVIGAVGAAVRSLGEHHRA